MEGLIFIALVVLIILLIGIKNQLSGKIAELSFKLDALKKQLSQLNVSSETSMGAAPKPKAAPEEIKKEETLPFIKTEISTPPSPQPDVKKGPSIAINNVQPKVEAFKAENTKQTNVKPPKPGFFERNPDLEKFIGENLINKIGIGILVLGIGFFVKYAISQNWINEIGRTAIGIACGGILIGLAHKMRKTFAAFSSVLVGGGLAVLYFTISIAFHQYHVFSQTVAFVFMVVITAFSVLLSISYDRKELAILAIIGGFSSPFMLSTGEGNYIVLFTYITILNIGMLALAYFKKWNVLNVISYLFTIVLYTGWLITKVINAEHAPYMGALIFATIFYLLFFQMNIINNVKESRRFNSLEISLLLSNTFLYFSAGMYILHNLHGGDFKGLFTALVAIFNFIFAYSLYKNEKVDKNLVFLLIGLVLTFLSLAAPIQLNGNQITMFWSAEAVLLLWLSQKSGIQLMKKASIIVMGLMFVSLLMDWQQIYFTSSASTLSILFNRGFITSAIAVTSIYLYIFFLKKEENEFILGEFKVSIYQKILGVAMLLFLYCGILFELRYQLDMYIAFGSTRTIIIGCYNYIFLIVLNFLSRKKDGPYFLETSVIMGFVGVLAYLLYYHGKVVDVRNAYLISSEVNYASFLFHYLDVALLLALLFTCYKNMQLKLLSNINIRRAFNWYISIVLIFIASAELDHIVVLNNYYPEFNIASILRQSHKIGFPILWGICSFILMFIGMKQKRDLRIISLTLFLVIILKLFLFDIRGISEGGKIAAFISLGVILLIVSFMYQKLKKLIMEDDIKIKSE